MNKDMDKNLCDETKAQDVKLKAGKDNTVLLDQNITITKREMLSALENIPDDGDITITVDHRDYEKAKKQYPNIDTVLLRIPGDYSYDEEGICFLTSAT